MRLMHFNPTNYCCENQAEIELDLCARCIWTNCGSKREPRIFNKWFGSAELRSLVSPRTAISLQSVRRSTRVWFPRLQAKASTSLPAISRSSTSCLQGSPSFQGDEEEGGRTGFQQNSRNPRQGLSNIPRDSKD